MATKTLSNLLETIAGTFEAVGTKSRRGYQWTNEHPSLFVDSAKGIIANLGPARHLANKLRDPQFKREVLKVLAKIVRHMEPISQKQHASLLEDFVQKAAERNNEPIKQIFAFDDEYPGHRPAFEKAVALVTYRCMRGLIGMTCPQVLYQSLCSSNSVFGGRLRCAERSGARLSREDRPGAGGR